MQVRWLRACAKKCYTPFSESWLCLLCCAAGWCQVVVTHSERACTPQNAQWEGTKVLIKKYRTRQLRMAFIGWKQSIAPESIGHVNKSLAGYFIPSRKEGTKVLQRDIQSPSNQGKFLNHFKEIQALISSHESTTSYDTNSDSTSICPDRLHSDVLSTT